MDFSAGITMDFAWTLQPGCSIKHTLYPLLSPTPRNVPYRAYRTFKRADFSYSWRNFTRVGKKDASSLFKYILHGVLNNNNNNKSWGRGIASREVSLLENNKESMACTAVIGIFMAHRYNSPIIHTSTGIKASP